MTTYVTAGLLPSVPPQPDDIQPYQLPLAAIEHQADLQPFVLELLLTGLNVSSVITTFDRTP